MLAIEPINACSVCGDDVRLSQVSLTRSTMRLSTRHEADALQFGLLRPVRACGWRSRTPASEFPPSIWPMCSSGSTGPSPSRTRRDNGVGLGLAIAKSAVAAHGGDIWLESQLGRGTVLRVELPLMEGASTLTARDSPRARRLPMRASGRPGAAPLSPQIVRIRTITSNFGQLPCGVVPVIPLRPPFSIDACRILR